MKVKRIQWMLVLVLNLLNAISVAAQEKRVLTLQEAIDLRLKNSSQLKVSRAKVEEATAATKEALERRLPAANLSAAHLRINSPHIELKTKPNNGSGGSTPQESNGTPSSATYGIANISLPIYAGGQVKYGIESTKFLEEAAKFEAENDKESIVLNTIDAFNNLYKTKAAVDVVKESLESSRERVRQLTNLEKNGLLARNDLLKAELQASNIELSLLDAENNWQLANINMNLMLGLPENTELTPDGVSLQSDNDLKGVEEYVRLGLQSRNDLSALAFRRKAASTGVKAAKGDSYPNIALTGGYVAANMPNLVTVTNAINIGVGVQYNIGGLWKNNTKLEQARAREKQVEASEAILAKDIRLQVNQAYQNYLLSLKKIDVYQTAITQAEENFRIVRNKFQNQLSTTTELLDADVAQLQARLNVAFAKADASVAYTTLLQTAGLLLNQAETK